jgi:hypothetical protein
MAGASILGGLLAGKKGERQSIDPAELERLFGTQAIAGETQQLFQLLQSSPMFQNMINQSSIAGTKLANRSQAQQARAGLSGSGFGQFLQQAGKGLSGNLQRQGQAQLFQQALRSALQNIQQRQGIFAQSRLQQQGTPSFLGTIGGGLLNAGSGLLSTPGAFVGGGAGQDQTDIAAQLQKLGTHR